MCYLATGRAFFGGNSAVYGGAIYSFYETTLHFGESVKFTRNVAEKDGGGIYALGTDIVFEEGSTASFNSNSAMNGGALYFNNAAFLTLKKRATLCTFNNHASEHGGAMFHEDITIPTQCKFKGMKQSEIIKLPYCFIQLGVSGPPVVSIAATVKSDNDSSEKEGSFIYGGLLNRCQIPFDDIQIRDGRIAMVSRSIVPYKLFPNRFSVNKSGDIASQPYQLCVCVNDQNLACSSNSIRIDVHRGEKFTLFLLALDQLGVSTPTQITARVSKTARLKINQSFQTLLPNCSALSYSLYSTVNNEELILFPDGPCHDTGLARVTVNVALLPCPDGFIKSNERCVCEEKLKKYGADCVIDEEIYILRNNGSTFWIQAIYMRDSYQGLIHYKTCPADYCTNNTVSFTLDNPDMQCANNRSGMLCGACAANYSLMLGSSRCEECSNAYLALLLPFAASGIALVAFLSILRLTVATGMINSLILYANIVQSNSRVFLSAIKARNILTVFIAWLNLDLGFETCFYDGMTAYAQIWLQFAFPIYIWILVSFIILTSRYSITVSKLIGHNPIAVLATLLLMSYAKLLKMIIEVFSYVELDSPQNKTVVVWLKDATVPYLQSWHLFLTMMISLVLVFLFLPYTFFLLLGYKLYHYSGRKYLHWLNKLKPFLDSYYAPYRIHTRYWTGFLLLIRCALYIVFSFNSLQATNMSLLAVIVTFTAIIIISWLSVKIYRSVFVTLVEASMYLNLIILSAATLANHSSVALVYSLIGMAFAIMMWVIAYHFYILYIAKSAIWHSIEEMFISTFKNHPATSQQERERALTPNPHNTATKTVVELREALLESDS